MALPRTSTKLVTPHHEIRFTNAASIERNTIAIFRTDAE